MDYITNEENVGEYREEFELCVDNIDYVLELMALTVVATSLFFSSFGHEENNLFANYDFECVSNDIFSR